jgi:hypothetical protein
MKKRLLIPSLIIAIIASSLGGWYIFLRAQNNATSEAARARGFGSDAPSFSGSSGSTFSNIIGGIIGSPEEGEEQTTNTPPRLWKVSAAPAAGVALFGSSTSTSVQFVDRTTGNIFSANTENGTVARITNTLVPNVLHALWAGSEDVIMQSVDEQGVIQTFSASIVSQDEEAGATPSTAPIGNSNSQREVTAAKKLSGVYLEPDIMAIAVSPQMAEKIFYLVPNANGVLGITAKRDGTDLSRVWNFPIRGWHISWINPDEAVLSQKASSGASGNAYVLSMADGELTPAIVDKKGLSVAVGSAPESILYSTSGPDAPALFVRSKNGNLPLRLSTFADKCVWSSAEEQLAYCAVPQSIPNASLPDAWYRGETHLSDVWWKIDTASGSSELLLSPESEYGVALDVINPMMNDAGTYIVFLDNTTQTPWVMRINADEKP